MADTPAAGHKPTHTAYVVREGKSKGHWLEVGGAWPHKDGKGFDVTLSALPTDGRLVLRALDAVAKMKPEK